MEYDRRGRPVARRGGAAGIAGVCREVLLTAARALLTVFGIALLVLAILYMRLLQGPVVLPGLADVLVERLNAASDGIRVEARDVVLTLGEGRETSGLQFRDVEVRAVDGQRLIAAPRVGVRLHLSDLLHGRIRPVRIALIRPDAQIIRAADGRLRFGMGQGAGMALDGEAVGDAGIEGLAALVDAFAGDRTAVPWLAELDRVAVLGASLVYVDRRGGSREWRTRRADLRLWRDPGGARATLDLDIAREGMPDATLRVTAERPAQRDRTLLDIRFAGLPAADVAAQARQLDWLALIGGTVEGRASLTIGRDGALGAIEGTLRAEDGVIRGLPEPVPFGEAELDFRTDPDRERLTVERFRLTAAAVEASLTGYADLDRDAAGAIAGVAGQFQVGALRLDPPGIFAAPLDFDGGRITARWSLPERTVEVTDARLVRGPVAFRLDGRARATPEGWRTDLRAEAEGMTVGDLVAYWPPGMAGNARHWVARHIPAASIDRAVAQLRLGEGEPQVALDFDYSRLTADYVDGMTPIEEARGSGHLGFHDLYLTVDAGHIAPADGQRIELAGSTIAIRGFWRKVTPAEIDVVAEGPNDAILTLLDQPPLRLMERLDSDLGGVGGAAEVEASLSLPLVDDLRLAQIGIEARATLTDVAAPFALSPERTVTLTADRLELAADDARLGLAGEARIDGAPVTLDWREDYGGEGSARTLALSGVATPALLAAAGAEDLPVEGAPPFELTLRQAGDGTPAFTLDADLAPARVEIAALDWVKPAGTPARLHAEGTRGDGLDIDALTLEAPGLSAEGALTLDAGGRLVHARFDNVRQPGRGTFAATLQPGPDGVLDVALTGPELDLSGSLDGPRDDGRAEPVRLLLDVGWLRLADGLALSPAQARIERRADGAVSGRIEGRLGSRAPVAIDLELPATGPGTVRMTSPDAGAALAAAGFYRGAEGGTLQLDAQIGPQGGLTGRARIDDVTVRSQSTFRDVLTEGGLDSAGQEVSTGGLGFRKVWIPFSYHKGVLTLDDAIAVSPALALKLNGTVDGNADRTDLIGVLSPAYALTGALNEVPILGKLLGGEGEGVLAMTFRLSGPVDDPSFVVNPLSMLAPGFLRKIFSTPSTEVSEHFRDSISRQGR